MTGVFDKTGFGRRLADDRDDRGEASADGAAAKRKQEPDYRPPNLKRRYLAVAKASETGEEVE